MFIVDSDSEPVVTRIIMLNGSVSGCYWLVASIIISFLKASLEAWVLLVEINRW